MSEGIFQAVQETSPDGFMIFRSVRGEDGAISDFEVLYTNPAAERIVGRSASAMQGKHLLDEMPETRDSGLFDRYVAVVETGQSFTHEFRQAAGPGRRWVRSTAAFAGDGFALFLTDITARKRAEETLRFLADSSAAMVASRDHEATLREVARLAVPRVADWCAVDLLLEGGKLHRVALVHANPEQAERAWRLAADFPPDPTAPGSARVLQTRAPELFAEVDDETLRKAARSPAHLETLRALGLRSYLCVPILSRGAVFGTIAFAFAESQRRYDASDLGWAEELARTVGMSIDNALLFRDLEEARALLEEQTAELEARTTELEQAQAETEAANEDLLAQTERTEEARRQADEANQAKSLFLATMSHELRTPLNAIGGYAELLEMGVRGPLTPTQREDLHKIRRNQAHLLALINDILNFVRIEVGQVHYEIADLPVNDTLAPLEATVEPQVRARRLRYRFVEGDPEVCVRTDAERTQQIVRNLLSNAVKFTDPGGEVELGWDADAEAVHIHVRDTGRGIPPSQLERIWEPFVQVDTGLTRGNEGAGLGLAISRDLARAMDGELSVASIPGEGSVFTLHLPRAPDASCRDR